MNRRIAGQRQGGSHWVRLVERIKDPYNLEQDVPYLCRWGCELT